MTLSAKRLGEKCGLTAEEMNYLLKEEGFLSGEPGNYNPTEKGKPFVVEKGDDNGYGGYAFRGWNWLEWDESILDELDTSMEHKLYIREKTSEERRYRREKKKAESEVYWRNVNRKNSEPEIEEYDESSGSSSRNLILGLFAAGYSIYKIVTYFKRRK